VAIVPFLYTVSVSLMNLTEATGGAWLPSTPQWKNYIDAWNEANFSRYFWNSVRIAAITVSGELVFCTLAAYAFARMEFWGKNLLFSLLLATLMLPEAIIWVPNFITVSWLGRIGPIAVDQQLAGADDSFHGERVQHLSAAPVLHAGSQRSVGFGADRRRGPSALLAQDHDPALKSGGDDAGALWLSSACGTRWPGRSW
jgi:ABC-type Fe3+ transport system permease subunit